MITSREFWNKRSEIYDAQVGPLYAEAYRKTVDYTLKYCKPDDMVLDFACGTGIVTVRIAGCVKKVQAIDIADAMVTITQSKVARQGISNVEVSQLDLFDESLQPGTFDVITANNVLLYVEDFSGTVKRIHDLLKPDGIFISATDCMGGSITKVGIKKFIKSHTGSMPYVAFFTQKGLAKKIEKNGFEVLECENLFPAPPNLFIAAKKR